MLYTCRVLVVGFPSLCRIVVALLAMTVIMVMTMTVTVTMMVIVTVTVMVLLATCCVHSVAHGRD